MQRLDLSDNERAILITALRRLVDFARSIGYGLWFLRIQPFEDGLQRLDLRR